MEVFGLADEIQKPISQQQAVGLKHIAQLAPSSVARSLNALLGPAGEASIAVADDSNEGAAATIVVLDAAGNVLDRKPTTVGEAT